ncbi:nucleoside-diphosphate sugar epimerase/dehydratase [Alteriqipengyuania sp. WL0013]|uniref:polysaccharide biosynthesis protein n=1 Tax=Alteriqipengyuania sp. WL0013 TaxID=3110773 RepID=UPI002BBC446D|nr:nucleoside-diphosphate sugar epimerase/dehydratase [Alteriqipengyuania sp. WL0013]MEB3415628.1 nucleoside-diphosphate sugar epimerase/dehydratase [Alteriqipengyuania sp. WL0013]
MDQDQLTRAAARGENAIAQAVLRTVASLSTLSRLTKQLIVVALDVVMLVVATWIAYSLRMDQWAIWPGPVQIMVLTSLLIAPAAFYVCGIYRTIFRFAGVGMLATLARGFILYGFLTFFVFTVVGIKTVPRTLGVLQPIIYFVLVGGVRIFIRYLVTDVLRRGLYRGSSRRALIYGAGIAGQQLAGQLRVEPDRNVVGFIDDDNRLSGQRLDGLPVYASDDLDDVVGRLAVDDVLLAIPTASRRRRAKIAQRLTDLSVNVQTLPSAKDIIDGKVSIDDIRPLAIEDLLGRDPVVPDENLLSRNVRGRCVLVTGAGGSIGSELCRQILAIGASRLVLFELSEYALYRIERELRASPASAECEIVPVLGSVQDGAKLAEVFARYGIETVFHAAAYKHVPLIEANPLEGIANNILGTHQLARAAVDAGVSDFILISTDKAVRPTNVMGASKRAAEQVVQAFAARQDATRFSMVRFGNVLGSSGSVVPLFDRQIREGGPITLTHRDITRYFMTIPEAANLVIQAGGMAKGGEVFVLDMGKPVRIENLARSMVRLSGLTVRDDERPDGDIEIVEVGLRPGEKLYEELLIGNSPQRTSHERVMMATEDYIDWASLDAILDQLRSCRDRDQALRLLKELVPDFQHRRDDDVGNREA